MSPPPSSGDDRSGYENDSLSIDCVLDLLRDPVRRQTVAYCVNASDRILTVDELADHLADEREPSRDRLTRESIAAELHHHHLPKLADEDVIEFDHRSGHVRYWGDDRLERWVRRIQAEASN